LGSTIFQNSTASTSTGTVSLVSVFSALKDGPISPSYAAHEPVWPKPARDGDAAAQGMYHADRIGDELASPPADWLVVTREYATQSGDVAAMEPDCANGWYDRDGQELHLVVPTQSPQEVAEGVAAARGHSEASAELTCGTTCR